MKITVGQFNESFPPMVDGVANVVKNYAYWVNKKYGQCSVITPTCPEAVDNYEFDVKRYSSVRVPLRGEYRYGIPQMNPSFWRNLKKVPFDIVHTHSPFNSGVAARSIAKKRKIPIVATFHSKFKEDFKVALKVDKLVDAVIAGIVSFYESVDEVWTVNKASIETLREYGYKGNIHVVENGCDIKVQHSAKEANESIEKMFGLSSETPLFMYIGQHIWQKNLKMVVESLKLLKDRGADFHMLFIGDGAKKIDMERMVEKYGLKGNVTFGGKIFDRNIVSNIYLRSSAMLFPSLYDTSSLVPREAAACGCPTVFVKDSSTSEGITEENGFLIDNTAKSLADAAEFIIKNSEKAEKTGQRARDTIYRSWEDAIEVAHERYLYLIEAKKQAEV